MFLKLQNDYCSINFDSMQIFKIILIIRVQTKGNDSD